MAYIGLDCDGTAFTHDYPRIGKDIGSVPILRRLVDNGHKIVVNTMRSGKELQEAVDWLQSNGIPLYGINNNPSQGSWTSSPKVYAELYLDDAALNFPLKFDATLSDRAFADWDMIEVLLTERGYI